MNSGPPCAPGSRLTYAAPLSLFSYAAQAQRLPSSSEWSLLSAGSASGCSSLEDQSPSHAPLPHEARVAAYLAKGTSSSAASMAAAAAAMATAFLGSGDEEEEGGEWEEAEDEEEGGGGGVRASDLPEARFDFGDYSFGDVHADAPDMGAAIAALRQRLGQARGSATAASSSSRVPSMAQLRARLDALAPHSDLVDPPSGIALSEAQRRQLSEAWREEQAAPCGRVDEPPRRPSDLAGDPNEGVDPTTHSSSGDRKSQTEQLNQQLLASFKASLDRVGASYCPMMNQASSEPGEV